MLKGSCLCGALRFEIVGPHSGIGICHCSLCRKCSGTGSMATVVVAFEHLRWIAGEELVAFYERASGYGSAFCRTCGSPAPDHDRNRRVYRFPPGLLDGPHQLPICDHIFVGSKASWDVIGDDAPQFEGDGPARPRVHP